MVPALCLAKDDVSHVRIACEEAVVDELAYMTYSRMYVHLSPDEETASLVGVRHGSLAMLRIFARDMFDDGHCFYISQNGVWLTDQVPPEYFEQIV